MDMLAPSEIAAIVPEIFILGMACAILVADLFLAPARRPLLALVALLTLAFAALISIGPHGHGMEVVFSGAFVRDRFGDLLKVFVYLSTAGVFIYARDYLQARGLFKAEFYVLGLLGVLGMMILISAHNLIVVFLGLELLALCQYALVALDRDSGIAAEVAMKYFVLGAIASGMLLFGMSMIYGALGTLDLGEIASGLAGGLGDMGLILGFGLAFLVVGIAFKLGAVPFHMWIPDVYEGSPTAVTIYLATAPKIAAFAMAIRLLVVGLPELQPQWEPMLVFLAVLSIGVGNVAAIAQRNIKRMLGYSTISHVGYLLLGLLTGTEEGYAASMFYVIAYAFMSLSAFGMIILLSRKGFEADLLDDFKGLNRRSPWFAAMMLLTMASLAGLPPFVGFFAKLFVLKAAVDAGLVWLAVLALVFAVVGAYYYLRIIWLMYFEDTEEEAPLGGDALQRTVLSLNGLGQLLVGVFAGSLMGLCTVAVSGLP